MFKKKCIFCIVVTIMLTLSILPNIASQSLKTESEKNDLTQSTNIKKVDAEEYVELGIFIYRSNGEVEKKFKTMSKVDLENMEENIIEIMGSNLGYIEKFENIL